MFSRVGSNIAHNRHKLSHPTVQCTILLKIQPHSSDYKFQIIPSSHFQLLLNRDQWFLQWAPFPNFRCCLWSFQNQLLADSVRRTRNTFSASSGLVFNDAPKNRHFFGTQKLWISKKHLVHITNFTFAVFSYVRLIN